jgi:hypothetical protein
VYQSLPRLLSIWFDYAALGLEENNGGQSSNSLRGNNTQLQPSGWHETITDMQTIISKK